MHTPISAIFLAADQRSIFRRFWFPEPNSTFAPRQDDLFMFIFWVSVFFFVLLMGLMFLFVWKYRRTPQRQAPEPSPSHNTPLEVTWTVAPLFLLVIMFVWGFKDFMYMNIAPGDAEEIQVTAQQWNWDFTYANGAGTDEFVEVADKEVPIFAVPADRPIKLVMSSQDVIHSFWVPGFRVKMDIMPNRYTTLWFEATGEPEPHYNDDGEHLGDWKDHYLFCTEYCGEGHGQMGAIIRVMPASQYDQWKADKADIFKGRSLAEVGQILYTTKGCASCHTTDGTSSTGPTWEGVYGSTETMRDGTTVEVDENYLRESILQPSAKIVRGYSSTMPITPVNDEELNALIAYIKSLSEEGQAELEQQQEQSDGGEA